jgi:hypothetical protein
LSALPQIGSQPFSGGRQELPGFAVDRPGADGLRMHHSFWIATVRAHYGQSKINSRLCSLGNFDPEEWDLPPKPKWMRCKTYNRYEKRFDGYEAQLDDGLEKLVAKLKLLESK